MRITKRTNIAVRVLMYCAAHPNDLVTKAAIADCVQVSENHVAQVIHQLNQTGFLATQRGRHGGMRLGMPADAILIGDVFRKIEGSAPLVECFVDAEDNCPLRGACRLRVALCDAVEAFYARLDEVTLEALVCDNDPLMALLNAPNCAKPGLRS